MKSTFPGGTGLFVVFVVLVSLVGPRWAQAQDPPTSASRDPLLLAPGNLCNNILAGCSLIDDFGLRPSVTIQGIHRTAGPLLLGAHLQVDLSLFRLVEAGVGVPLAMELSAPIHGLYGPLQLHFKVRPGPRIAAYTDEQPLQHLTYALQLALSLKTDMLPGDARIGSGCGPPPCLSALDLRFLADASFSRLLIGGSAGLSLLYEGPLPGGALAFADLSAWTSLLLFKDAGLWLLAEGQARLPLLPPDASASLAAAHLLFDAGVSFHDPATGVSFTLAAGRGRGLDMPDVLVTASLAGPIGKAWSRRWFPRFGLLDRWQRRIGEAVRMRGLGFVDPVIGPDGCILDDNQQQLGMCGQQDAELGWYRFTGGRFQAGQHLWLRNGSLVMLDEEGQAHLVTQLPDLSDQPVQRKLTVALSRSVSRMPRQLQQQVEELLSPESISLMAAMMAGYGASHLYGAGELADVVLAVTGVVLLGRDAITLAQDVNGFVQGAAGARTEQDLDRAAERLAHAVGVLGVDAALRALSYVSYKRVRGKAGGGKPPADQKPALKTDQGKAQGLGGDGPVQRTSPTVQQAPAPEYRALRRHEGDARVAGGPINARGRYCAALREEGLPQLPNDWDVHHSIPQKLRGQTCVKGIDLDAPENLRGVPGGRAGSNLHQEITNQWERFLKDKSNWTRDKILNFRDSLDNQYGDVFWESRQTRK